MNNAKIKLKLTCSEFIALHNSLVWEIANMQTKIRIKKLFALILSSIVERMKKKTIFNFPPKKIIIFSISSIEALGLLTVNFEGVVGLYEKEVLRGILAKIDQIMI